MSRKVTITVPQRDDFDGVYAGGRKWESASSPHTVVLTEEELQQIVWRPHLLVMEGNCRLTSEGPGKPIISKGPAIVEDEVEKTQVAQVSEKREQIPEPEKTPPPPPPSTASTPPKHDDDKKHGSRRL